MKNLRLVFATLFISAPVLMRCNIEVGNPDNTDGVVPGRSLSLQMLRTGECATASADCVAVPVTTDGSLDINLIYDMNQAVFDLAAIELAPFAEQQARAQTNLISGAAVPVDEPRALAEANRVALRFEGSGRPTAMLSGTVRGTIDGRAVSVAVSIPLSGRIMPVADVPAGEGILSEVVFDPRAWFDFTSASADTTQALSDLASGSCPLTGSSVACEQSRERLLRHVARQISRSMSAKRKK